MAEEALAGLQTATAKIVLDVLEDAGVDIYHLRYEDALGKYNNARQIGLDAKARPIWIKGMLELTYFYNETGRDDPCCP